MTTGIILYGPPAAGKDAITSALRRIDPDYVLFSRLKVGPGRTAGYRMTTESTIAQLRDRKEVVWENSRYGATYVVDKPSLHRDLAQHTPVLHLGQVEAVHAVMASAPDAHWIVVYVWCPRDVAQERIVARGTGDTDARLRAWDETEPIIADITLNTAATTPKGAAQVIANHRGKRRFTYQVS